MIQEGCVFEWHNIIAAAAREGFAGEDELQWSSYKILSEQLQQEWLESIEKRKTMPRLLIAEAEKAVQALELAALTNPVAQASLLETRKLIAEATWSIKNIERGQLTSQGTRDQTFSDSVRPINHLKNSPGNLSGQKWPTKLVNGTHLLSSSISYHRDLDFVNLSPSTEETSGSDSFLHDEFLMRKSVMTDNQTVFSKVGGSIRYKILKSEEEESDISEMKNNGTSGSSLLLKKKNWVRGRLVEVEEDDDVSK
ncbi:hypothetical protein BHE74_00002133 [Ensete ventricosum]|nr:hypothetical protein BHE74_00002133 [Ensete ventricosum]